MTKIKMIFMFSGFLLAAAIAAPAQAEPWGGGGKKDCKGNWDRVKVKHARCEHEARKIDKNGNHDDWVCEKYNYGNIKYRDNDDY